MKVEFNGQSLGTYYYKVSANTAQKNIDGIGRAFCSLGDDMIKYGDKSNQKERTPLKHKLTLAVCVIVGLVIGVLSVQAYNRHQAQLAGAKSSLVAARAKATAAKNQAQAKFYAQVGNLQALCKKDLEIYQALPAAQQAKQPAPDCSLAPVK